MKMDTQLYIPVSLLFASIGEGQKGEGLQQQERMRLTKGREIVEGQEGGWG